jgi:glycosyltransferase involved in cell wall biosynthesis
MTRIHVIQTVGSLDERKGGPPRTVTSLCSALARTDVRVNLISGTDTDDDALMLPPATELETRLVHGRNRFGVTLYPGFGAAIDAAVATAPGERAIVHDNGIWAPSNIAACYAARRRGLAYVVTPHGMLEPWAMQFHGGRKKLAWLTYQRRLLEGSVGLIATAEQERVSIRALLPDVPIAVIANGVDCPAEVPTTDPESKMVLYMSRFHPKKNLIGLLDAWAMICADSAFSAWRLTIAGPDERGHTAEVIAHAERIGVAGRVDFVRQVADSDKAALFAAAAVFILPSFTENFGIVVAEALAHGLPVIATRGAPWHDLETYRCGWWVEPAPASLADALRQALGLPPGERRAMGERGHRYVSAVFRWDHIAVATAQFYHWTVEGGKAPDFVDA